MHTSRPRTRVVFCRLSEDELSQLVRARDTFGFCNTSEAIRSAVMRMVREQGGECDHLLTQLTNAVAEISRTLHNLAAVVQAGGIEHPPDHLGRESVTDDPCRPSEVEPLA